MCKLIRRINTQNKNICVGKMNSASRADIANEAWQM